jgi:hypothetical protein
VVSVGATMSMDRTGGGRRGEPGLPVRGDDIVPEVTIISWHRLTIIGTGWCAHSRPALADHDDSQVLLGLADGAMAPAGVPVAARTTPEIGLPGLRDTDPASVSLPGEPIVHSASSVAG